MPVAAKSSRKKAAKPYDASQRPSASASTSTSTPQDSAISGGVKPDDGDKSSKKKKKRSKLDSTMEEETTPLAEVQLVQAPEQSEMSEDRPVSTGGKTDKRAESNDKVEDASSIKRRKKLEKKKRKRSSQPAENVPPSQGEFPSQASTTWPSSSHETPSTSTSKDKVSSSSPVKADDPMSTYLAMTAPASEGSPTKAHDSRTKDKKEKDRESRKKEAIQAIVSRQVEEEAKAIETRLQMEMQNQLQAMKQKISELEAEAEVKRAELEKRRDDSEQRARDLLAKEEMIANHEKIKEQLKEAVGCGVCFETLRDPHILSCGHVACRSCLQSWFRTPGAYVHQVPDPLPEHVNLEFFTKVCHVCRTYIVSRPSRMYHLQSILEPLGIESHLPSASQTEHEADIWKGMFPPEKDQYRIHDTSDHVDRCPQCFAEIDEGECTGCGAEFSVADEEVADFDTEDGVGNDEEAHEDNDAELEDLGDDAVNDMDDSDNDLDSVNDSDGDDWLDNDLADGAGPERVAFREAMIAAREGRRDRHRARRASPSASRSPPRLPPGLSNFLDDMADESDDYDMTDEDGGDEEIGERGDYPSGPEESDSESAMARGDDESEGYDDSFIDDESVHDDVDGDALSDSPTRDAPIARGGRKKARDASVDSIASAGSEPSIDELRRKRIQAMEQRSGAPSRVADAGQENVAARPSRPSRGRGRIIVVSDDDE